MPKINPYVGEITEKVFKEEVLALFAINKWLSSFFVVAPHILYIVCSNFYTWNYFSFIAQICYLPFILLALIGIYEGGSEKGRKGRVKHLYKFAIFNYFSVAIYSAIYIYYMFQLGDISISSYIHLNKDDFCAISYEPFKDSEIIMGCARCTSIYKREYINQWFQKCGKIECPMCRHNYLRTRIVKHKA